MQLVLHAGYKSQVLATTHFFWRDGFPNITNPDSRIQVNFVEERCCTMTCLAQAHPVAQITSGVPVLASPHPKMKAARNKAAIRLHDRWAWVFAEIKHSLLLGECPVYPNLI